MYYFFLFFFFFLFTLHVEGKTPPPSPPLVINFGEVWPTPEPLHAILGTNVLWFQGSYKDRKLLQSSYTDGLQFPKLPAGDLVVAPEARFLNSEELSPIKSWSMRNCLVF